MSRAKELLEQATPLPWVDHFCSGKDGGAECWQDDPHHDVFHPEQPGAAFGIGVLDIDSDVEADPHVALALYAVNRLPDYEAAVEALTEMVEAWETWHLQPAETRFQFGRLTKARDEARTALARLRDEVPA